MALFRATMTKGKVSETVVVDFATPEGRAQLQALIQRAISDWVEARVVIERCEQGPPSSP
jgi:hypothetical protein